MARPDSPTKAYMNQRFLEARELRTLAEYLEPLSRFRPLRVLRSNARISPLHAVLRYRDLLQVEDLFRTAKALMRTRPIYHSSDAATRGHVFCSFLALVLRKELDERCRIAGLRPEWADVLRASSIGCRRSSSTKMAGRSSCALPLSASSARCSMPPALRYPPIFANQLQPDLPLPDISRVVLTT